MHQLFNLESENFHPMAIVHNDCTIGKGTKIHQFASVTRGTVLGEDCVVWPFAMLDGPVFGDRCKIASGVAMGAGFKIGNDCFIGPNVVLANDMWPSADKDGYDDERLRGGIDFAVIIGDRVSIGAGAIILPGVKIGSDTIIGAGVIVRRSVGGGVVVVDREGQFAHARPEMRPTRMRWAR